MKKILSIILFVIISKISYSQSLHNNLYHFGSGFTIGSSATFNYHRPTPDLGYGEITKKSFMAGTMIAFLKETYDVSRYGVNELNVNDIVSMSLGTVTGSLVVYTIKKKLKKRKLKKSKDCPQF
jgi:hypothetical protein